MKTLYIDIYFLINFTVDLLTLYFSTSICKIKTSIKRLLLASFVGGTYAVFAIILIEYSLATILLSPTFIIMMVSIVSPKVGIYRRIKYCVSFVLLQLVIGGTVYYAYCTLNRFFENVSFENTNGVNKKLLILSLFVLLSIGVVKIVISLFSSAKSERCVEVKLLYGDKTRTVSALVDSGNLVSDPFDKSPIMFVNSSVIEELFSVRREDVYAFDALSYEIKKRLRPISISSLCGKKLIYAIKPDEAYIIYKDKKERVALSLGISDEDSFGGHSALIPLTAVEDIL